VTVEFALFLSPEGIALAHRQQAGHWALVAESGLNGDDLGASMAKLKAAAAARGGAKTPVLLVLPDDQVLYTSFTAPADDAALVEERITEGLDGMTPYAVSELLYDWRPVDIDRVKVAVVAKETLGEATEFASAHGFESAGFAAMPPAERFPGMPLFGDTRDDWGLDRAGMAFGSDDWVDPVKAPPAEPDAKKDATSEPAAADAASTGEPEATPTTKPGPQAAPEPATKPEPTSGVTPGDTSAPGSDRATGSGRTADRDVKARVEEPPSRDTPKHAGKDAAGSDDETRTPIADPSLDKPIAPLEPDEDTAPQGSPAASEQAAASDTVDVPQDAAEPKVGTAATATRGKVAGATSRPLKAEKPADAPARPENAAPITPTPRAPEQDDAAGDSDAVPTPRFSARRDKAPRPDSGAGDMVSTRSSRLGFGASTEGDGSKILHPDAAPAPVSKPDPGAPARPANKLAAQLARVRDASKSRKQPAAPEPMAAPPAPTSGSDTAAPGPLTAFGVAPVDAKAARETPPDMMPDSGAATNSGLAGSGRSGDASAQPASPDERGTADQAFTTGLLARKTPEPSGPSLRTGLVLTVILLILLALIAIWSVLFLPDSPLGRLLNGGTTTETATLSEDGADSPAPPTSITAPPALGAQDSDIGVPATDPDAEAPATDPAEVAALTSGDAPMPETETVVEAAPQAEPLLPDIDADLDLPPLPPLPEDMLPSLEETERIYEEDEIWVRPPDRPSVEPLDSLNDLYVTSIDPEVPSMDAIALADPGINPGELLRRIPPPPPFGEMPTRDARGLVQPTPEGVLTPEGAFVVLGRPAVTAQPRPLEEAPAVEAVPEINVEDAILGTFIPRQRPTDLQETRERQILGGFSASELAGLRPDPRPVSAQESAAMASLFPRTDAPAASADAPAAQATRAAVTGTALAIPASRVPPARPANIDELVAAAAATPGPAVAIEAVARAPRIPSNADVTRAATERNAIRLRDVNLIGVTGTPSDRRALVRLPSGRFVRVGVGDRLDGGRVAAIGETSLQYVRNGRNLTLEIPG
jgi:hypothetical protein